MERSESRYPMPQWAEKMERTLTTKIETQSPVLALIVSQLEEIRCGMECMRQQSDTNTKAMESQLQKLQDIVRHETGGAW